MKWEDYDSSGIHQNYKIVDEELEINRFINLTDGENDIEIILDPNLFRDNDNLKFIYSFSGIIKNGKEVLYYDLGVDYDTELFELIEKIVEKEFESKRYEEGVDYDEEYSSFLEFDFLEKCVGIDEKTTLNMLTKMFGEESGKKLVQEAIDSKMDPELGEIIKKIIDFEFIFEGKEIKLKMDKEFYIPYDKTKKIRLLESETLEDVSIIINGEIVAIQKEDGEIEVKNSYEYDEDFKAIFIIMDELYEDKMVTKNNPDYKFKIEDFIKTGIKTGNDVLSDLMTIENYDFHTDRFKESKKLIDKLKNIMEEDIVVDSKISKQENKILNYFPKI